MSIEPLLEPLPKKIARLLDEYIAKHGKPPFWRGIEIDVSRGEDEEVEINKFYLERTE